MATLCVKLSQKEASPARIDPLGSHGVGWFRLVGVKQRIQSHTALEGLRDTFEVLLPATGEGAEEHHADMSIRLDFRNLLQYMP